jgi:hypothetical protein
MYTGSKEKKNYGKIYLRWDNLDWFLSYAADELHCQNVHVPDDAPIDDKRGNCTEVADVHMQWDFTRNAWDAKFVDGPHTGTIKSFSTSDLTRNRCTKMKEVGTIQDDIYKSSYSKRKEATRAFLTQWCIAIQNNDGEKLEDTFELRKELETPKKKPRFAKQGCTVVADEPVVEEKRGTVVADDPRGA